MHFEVFIPSAAHHGPDLSMFIEAKNWLGALRVALDHCGEKNNLISMYKICPDNSVEVTDATSHRIFKIKPSAEAAGRSLIDNGNTLLLQNVSPERVKSAPLQNDQKAEPDRIDVPIAPAKSLSDDVQVSTEIPAKERASEQDDPA